MRTFFHRLLRSPRIGFRPGLTGLAAAALLLGSSVSQAQVASVWRYGSGGTWTTTTNWLPFFTPGSNVGDIAVVQSNITADQTITLDGARTLGVMVLGDQSGTSNFTIAPGSGGSLTFDNIGDIALLNRITGGNDTINANITLNDDLRVRNFINDNARALVIGGTVSGPGSLTFLGNGRLQILGQINTDLLVDNRNSNNNADQVTLGRTTGNAVTGDITIGNVTTGGVGYAILELAAGRANTDLISDSSRVIIDGLANTTTVASVNPDSGGRWAKFDLNGVNETIGSLMDTRGGAVLRSTGSNPSTLTIAGSGDSFFEGVIQDGGSGAFSINNSGSGNLTLEGAWIRHTGTTGVSGTGTLELKNLTTDFVSSGIQVGPAGTLVLTKTTNNNLTLSQRVTGGGDVVFNASGTTNSGLTLSASNNVIGDLSVNLGRAIFSGSNNTFASIHVGGHDLIGLGELQLNGSASVAGDVTLVGTGNTNSETEFRGAVSVGGAISINNGTLKLLNNGAITTNAPITVAARPTSSNLSGLVLDNSSVSNGNRIGTGAITYYGGEFNFNGGGGTNESLGSLTLNQGAFYFNHSGTGTVTFSNLTRSAGSTLNIGRADLGTTSSNRLLFTSGTPGMTNSVVSGGWAVVGTDWATIGANGITALTTYETSTSQSNWATTENIKIEAGSVSGVTSRTIATLNFSGATNRTLNMSTTTQTLTIGNGGILSSGANHTLGTNGNLTTSGGAPLHFHVQDHQLNLTSTLTGSMAVVKSGNGLLILNDGANSHTGGLIINQGTVRVNGVERMLGAIPATSNPNSVQINGGILQFHGGTGSVINVDPKRGIHIGEAGGRIAVGANITNLIDVTIPQVSADGILELAVEGPAGAGSSLVLGTTGVAANFASGIRMLGGFEGDTTFLGNNTIGGAVTINSGDVTFSGTNDFQGDLRISSATLTLLGANTVGGDIRVNSGALVLGAANALGSGPVAISLVGSDSVSGGDLDLGGYDLEIGSFYEDSVNSTIDNDGTSLFSTLTFSNDRRVVVNALIQEGLSYLNLKKTGIGELLLQNNSSTFSGNVEIFEGALTVRSIANEGLPSGLGVLYSAADPATLVLDGGALVMDLLNASVTDRSFTLGTGPNAGALVSNAGLSPSSVFIGGANSAPVAFTGSGDRTLTLGGLNLGDNTFNLVLGDGPGGVTSLIKEDRGVWHINSSNTYTGLTTVLGAINSSYGSGTSRLYVGANEALGAAGGAGTILASGGLFLDNVNYTTPENLYFEGGILESEAGYSTWAGDWYVNVNSYLRLQEGATIHQNGDLIGTRSLEILGGGTLELAGTHQTGGASNADYYAAEVRLREGGLVLDYTVNNNSKLANGNILRLGGGRREAILTLRGGNHVELINRAQLDAGRIEVYRDGGTSTINFGNLSGGAVANGASLYVDEEDLVRTTRDNVNGILGSWVTVRDNIAGTGDISWGLKNAGTGANGFIVALSPSSYIINAFATGGNTDVTASFTVPSGSTTNTLRFNEPVDAAVVLSGGSNNIQSGGILVTPSVDWAQPCIEGPGTLYTQAATLQVNQYNLNAPFTIAAEITNDGATARSLDVVGGGTVVLTEANSYTGVTTISGSTLLATQLADGGVPSSIGASTNSNGNLQLIGGTLEYLGESTSTNRGFTLANSGTISVGHDRTILTQTGSISPNDTESTDTVIKAGTGTWAFSGVASGVRSWDIAEGTLQLLSNSANNRFGNPTYATLRVSGGTLEYVGDTAASRSQQFGAEFVVGQGGSTIGVTSVADGGTARNATLILQGGEVNTSVIREPGGVVHFFENPLDGAGVASIELRNPIEERGEVLPWATYSNPATDSRIGINDFALVTTDTADVVPADSAFVYTIGTYSASLWNNPQRQVSEGDLTVDNFNATLTADATVGTMRYINQNDGTLTIPAGLNLEVAHGGILIGTNVFNNDKKILGAGTLNGGLANSEGSRDILIHNYNPAASFEIGVKITSASVEIASTDKETGGGDAGGTIAAGSSILEIGNDSYVNLFTNIEVGMLVTGPGIPDGTVVVSFDGGANQNVTLSAPASANVSMGDFSFVTLTNFVNAGTGTTTLSGSNTYSGSTIISGGSLLLANANAIPGGIGATGGTSALIVKGGVVGLGAGDFTRDIGSDEESILFTGSGGFAAYGSDRTVNLGGAGATVGFGRGDFVPSASDLILGWGDSTHKVTFVNPLDLGAVSEMVRVENGFAEVDGELAGGLQGRGRLVKGGLGTLRLSATSTSTGGVELAEGELRLANVADVAGTGVIQLGTSPTNTLAEAQMTLTLEGGTIANDWKAGGGNDDGNNLIQALADVTLSGAGTLEQQVLLGSEPGVTMSLIGDIAGTSAGGFTVINEGVVELSGNNSYGGGSVAGTAIDGDTIVRSGTLELGSDTAAGTGVIELGDALPAVLTADVATTGRNMTLNGGYFDEEHNGLAAQAGGPGAFVQVSEDVNGVDYSALANGTRVLIKDQGENPEQNGIYEIVRLPDQPAGTMNLVRVSDFDETSELAYGTRVDVTGGASYFVADSVAGANTSAVNFREDVVNPDVALLINETGVMVANDIDINATNGTGTTSLGGAPSLTTGTAEFSGDVVLQDVIGGVQEAKTVILTSATPTDEGVTFSGSFSEADTGGGATDDILSIIKQGAGTVTLTGESTYTGPTTVSAGTLLVNNSNVISGSATGSGLVTVESGATLGGIGRIGGSVAVVGTAGNLATLSPGTPSTTDGIGTLTVGGNLELGEYSQTLFTLGGNGFNDQVVTGTLTVDPSAIFKVLFDLTYEPNVMIGDTFNLFDWTGLVSGDSNMVDNLELPTLSGGLVWNTSQFNSTGVISITGVPEPARWALLLTGLLAICLRRRR